MSGSVEHHGENSPRIEFDERKKLVYDLEHSPSHFKRPAHYLKQLRECGDYRNCDIELVTSTGSENIHSAIAAAHCRRIAKLLELHDTPLRIDMRRFQLESVLNVVEWMYNGKVEMVWEHMADHMAVTNYLGVVFLHHQLENTLKTMAKEATTRIEAVNVASHPTTGVSPETVSHIVHVIHERYATLSTEEIMLLQPWAIKTLVATSVKTPMKISLINIALNWLREQQNIVWLDVIVSNIFIDDMNLRELIAFQKTLRAVLLNPSTRRLVRVSLDKDKTIAINMDKADWRGSMEMPMKRSERETVSSSPANHKTNLFYPLLMHEKNREQSACSLSELPSYTNVASLFSSTESDNSEESVENYSNQQMALMPLVTESLVEAIKELPPAEEVFRKNSAPSQMGNPMHGSTSGKAAQRSFHNGKASIVPDESSTKHATNRERRLHYTRSEIEELHNYPSDTFTKTKPETQGATYTKDDMEEFRPYPIIVPHRQAPPDGNNVGSINACENKRAQQDKVKKNSDG